MDQTISESRCRFWLYLLMKGLRFSGGIAYSVQMELKQPVMWIKQRSILRYKSGHD